MTGHEWGVVKLEPLEADGLELTAPEVARSQCFKGALGPYLG